MGLTYEVLQQHLDQLSQAGHPDDPKERRRMRILRAAQELFIKRGYRKTSISDVAEQAGVAKGTVYLHVKTKAELMGQALNEEKRQYLEVLRPVFDMKVAPRERLRRWLETVLILSTKMPLVSRLISGDREIVAVLEELDQELLQKSITMQEGFVAEMLDRAAQPHRWTTHELRDRAKVLIGLLYASGTFAQPWVRSDLSCERFASILADLVVDGVGHAGTNGQPGELTDAEVTQDPNHQGGA